MAVNTTENVKSYACGEDVTDFAFPFSIIGTDTSVLEVTIWDDATSTPTVLAEESGDYSYSVSAPNNNYENGGTVSTTKLDGAAYIAYAYDSGYTITIERIVPYTQPSEFAAGGLNNKALEQTFDNLEFQIQQLDKRKSIHGPPSDPATLNYEIPGVTARKGRVLGFDDTTGEVVAVSALPTSGVSITAFGETLIDDNTAVTAQGTLKLKDSSAELDIASLTTEDLTANDLITKGPWVDIRAYGAGTGETAADNAVAIQAALDAAETAGSGVVFIPPGTFEYDTTLTMASYIGIVGTGPYSSILEFTAIDSTNAIECKGTGDDVSTGTPKDWCWMRELQVRGNASSGHGIVFDIVRYCTFFNVYSLGHGGDCWHFGAPPVAASYLSRIGRIVMINGHSSGGVNSVYAAGGGINITGQCGFNNASAIGIILEDMRLSYINGISGGGNGSHAIEIRSSALIGDDDHDMFGIHLNNIHWEGLSSGDAFLNVNMGTDVELRQLSITDCEYTPRAANGIVLAGIVKHVNIERNYMQSRRTVDAAIGITIGASCEDINVGPNYWPYNLNINNGASVGELHCSEEHSRSTVLSSTSGVGEDIIASITIKASYLETHGGLKIKAAGTKTGANDTKEIKLHFGASSWIVHAAANNQNDWRLEAEIINTATNAQKVSWVCWDGATVLQGYETAAIDTTAAVDLKITGECVNAGDIISREFWRVERF